MKRLYNYPSPSFLSLSEIPTTDIWVYDPPYKVKCNYIVITLVFFKTNVVIHSNIYTIFFTDNIIIIGENSIYLKLMASFITKMAF
jgi:hypothetical protein